MKKGLLILFCLTTVVACNDWKPQSSVPAMPVYYVINIMAEDPHFVTANTGAYKIVNQRRFDTDFIGYAGLIIYIGMDADYHAFDLACPVCLNRDTTLTVDGIFAQCGICGEDYDLSFGYATPMHGKSKEALRKYKTYFDGTKLTIRD